MTLSVKQVTIKSDGDMFHETFRYRPHHISKMRPDNIKGVELHDGERGNVGSIFVWSHVSLNGKLKVAKEVIEAIDEEKRLARFKVIGGHILEAYKTFSITLHVETRGDESLVTWTFYYEKLNDQTV
ncbi:putative Bet v I/Major latex protein [Helianthus debilis subsp. tardiflorus]